jgi:hypothetical protein
MAAISTAIAVASLGVAAVGTAASIKSGKSQAKYARQAAEFQQKQANLTNARAKRDAVREARMAYGSSQNTAANQGVSSSSSSLGGLASIGSQVRDNVSFLDQYGFYSDQASKALGRSSAAGAQADMWGSVANLGFSVFGQSEQIANVFRPPQRGS